MRKTTAPSLLLPPILLLIALFLLGCHAITLVAESEVKVVQNNPLDGADCIDLRSKCAAWAAAGDCVKRARYMHPHCPLSCGVCHNRTRFLEPADTPAAQRLPRTLSSSALSSLSNATTSEQVQALDAIGKDIGVPQLVPSDIPLEIRRQVLARVRSAQRYVFERVMQEDRYQLVREDCRNYEANCAAFAVQGEVRFHL